MKEAMKEEVFVELASGIFHNDVCTILEPLSKKELAEWRRNV